MDLKYLYMMFPTKEKRNKFIINSALTFGLRLETLSKIFQIDSKTLKTELLFKTIYMTESMQALFEMGMNNQEQATSNFIAFYNELVESAKNKDKERIQEVMEVLKDTKAIKLMKRQTPGTSKLTDEEILTILKYQMKYFLSTDKIEKIFRVHHGIYVPRVNSLVKTNPELVTQFNTIRELYYDRYHSKGRN